MKPYEPVNRWSDLPLQKVTAMISRKVMSSDQQTLIQAYLKRGAQIPMHTHRNEQMVYVLQGSLRCVIGTRDVTVHEGEVLHVPAGVPHQAEAAEDTFELAMFTPGRKDWLEGGP